MRKYFPYVKKEFYDGISGPATKMIYDELQNMVSNGIRRSKGVGSTEDMKRRCTKVLKKIKINVPDKLE